MNLTYKEAETISNSLRKQYPNGEEFNLATKIEKYMSQCTITCTDPGKEIERQRALISTLSIAGGVSSVIFMILLVVLSNIHQVK